MNTDQYLHWVYDNIQGSRDNRRPLYPDNHPSVKALPEYHLWLGEEYYTDCYGREAWLRISQ